jgi:hypothetical protein
MRLQRRVHERDKGYTDARASGAQETALSAASSSAQGVGRFRYRYGLLARRPAITQAIGRTQFSAATLRATTRRTQRPSARRGLAMPSGESPWS